MNKVCGSVFLGMEKPRKIGQSLPSSWAYIVAVEWGEKTSTENWDGRENFILKQAREDLRSEKRCEQNLKRVRKQLLRKEGIRCFRMAAKCA